MDTFLGSLRRALAYLIPKPNNNALPEALPVEPIATPLEAHQVGPNLTQLEALPVELILSITNFLFELEDHVLHEDKKDADHSSVEHATIGFLSLRLTSKTLSVKTTLAFADRWQQKLTQAAFPFTLDAITTLSTFVNNPDISKHIKNLQIGTKYEEYSALSLKQLSEKYREGTWAAMFDSFDVVSKEVQVLPSLYLTKLFRKLNFSCGNLTSIEIGTAHEEFLAALVTNKRHHLKRKPRMTLRFQASRVGCEVAKDYRSLDTLEVMGLYRKLVISSGNHKHYIFHDEPNDNFTNLLKRSGHIEELPINDCRGLKNCYECSGLINNYLQGPFKYSSYKYNNLRVINLWCLSFDTSILKTFLIINSWRIEELSLFSILLESCESWKGIFEILSRHTMLKVVRLGDLRKWQHNMSDLKIRSFHEGKYYVNEVHSCVGKAKEYLSILVREFATIRDHENCYSVNLPVHDGISKLIGVYNRFDGL